jgi:hypothetical protein
MRRINTLAELRAERKFLRIRQAELEADIKKDVEDIKADLEPLRLLTKGAKKVLTSNKNSMLGTTAGLAADFISKNILVKNSGFLARIIVPFLARNAASNIVEDNKSKIADWLEGLIIKSADKKTTEEKV